MFSVLLLSVLFVAQERKENFQEKVKAIPGNEDVDHDTVDHLWKMFTNGELKEGENGMFYGELLAEKAPVLPPTTSRGVAKAFWERSGERKEYSHKCFVACMRVRFPLIIQEDPVKSALGTGMKAARDQGIIRYGMIGHTLGYAMFELTEDLVEAWSEGRVEEDMVAKKLGYNKAWKVDTFEVKMFCVPCILYSIKYDKTIKSR